MSNYAIITNGIVSNLYVSEEALNSEDVQSDTAQIGWSYANGVFSPPAAEPSPVVTADQKNAIIMAQITALELSQQRSLRDIGLGNGSISYTKKDGTTSTPVSDLQNIESQIAALRGQLVTG